MAEELAAVDGTGKCIADCSRKTGKNEGLKLASTVAHFDRKSLKFLSGDRGTDFGTGRSQQRRGRGNLDGFRLAAHLEREIDRDDLRDRHNNVVRHLRLEALFSGFEAIRAWGNCESIIAGAAGGSGPFHTSFHVGDGEGEIGNYTSAGILCGTGDGAQISLRKGSGSRGEKEAEKKNDAN